MTFLFPCNPLPRLFRTCKYISQFYLPTLPFLTSHCNKPIKQFVSQINCRQSPFSTLSINNLNPISNLSIHRPPDHQLGFPPQSANLPNLFDISYRHRKHRVNMVMSSDSCSKPETRNRCRCRNIYRPLFTLIPSLEIHR